MRGAPQLRLFPRTQRRQVLTCCKHRKALVESATGFQQVRTLRAAGRAAHDSDQAAQHAADESQAQVARLQAEVAALQGDLVALSESSDRERAQRMRALAGMREELRLTEQVRNCLVTMPFSVHQIMA